MSTIKMFCPIFFRKFLNSEKFLKFLTLHFFIPKQFWLIFTVFSLYVNPSKYSFFFRKVVFFIILFDLQ